MGKISRFWEIRKSPISIGVQRKPSANLSGQIPSHCAFAPLRLCVKIHSALRQLLLTIRARQDSRIGDRIIMDLSLTDRQESIKSAAREFFESECPTSLVRAMEDDDRGYPAEMWERMAAMGWMGLAFPERCGGSGGSLTDLAVLLEEFGRALVPGPFFETTAMVGLTILDAADEDVQSAILPRIADGSRIFSSALLEQSGRYVPERIETRAERGADGGFSLSGTKMFVEYANSADSLMVAAKTADAGAALFLAPMSAGGVRLVALDGIAREPLYAVHLDGAAADGEPFGDADAIRRAIDRAAILHCARSLGGARHVLEMTVEYAKRRVQFGRAIATFQAVQHACADMTMAIDSARLAAYEAITRIEDGEPADKEIALAKTLTNHAYKSATLSAQQIHGGIGFMEEYDLQLWTRRAKAAEMKYGASSGYVERFAQAMGLA